MAQTCIQGGRAVGQVMLKTDKAAGQGVGAGLVEGRVGFAHHPRAEAGAVILG